MKLKEWALVAEIVGGFAIIATLVIFIFETRENTAEMRVANRHQVVSSLRELSLARAQNSSLSAAVAGARSGRELTPAEAGQYGTYFYAVIKSVEEDYLQYRDGRLDKEYLETRIAGLMYPAFLGNETGRTSYELHKRRAGSYRSFLS